MVHWIFSLILTFSDVKGSCPECNRSTSTLAKSLPARVIKASYNSFTKWHDSSVPQCGGQCAT